MRFVDSNVFIYAILKPRRKLSDEELALKDAAKSILRRIESGEECATSVVHLSEVINILSAAEGADLPISFLERVLALSSFRVLAVDKAMYALANELAKQIKIGINDCLAYALMRNNRITQIVSFDKDFDKVVDIARSEK